MKTNVQTNLLGKMVRVVPHYLHVWPWRTHKGEKRIMLSGDAVEPGDATCHAAQVVAVYVHRETDGSGGLRLAIAALDGQYAGQIREVYPDWVALSEVPEPFYSIEKAVRAPSMRGFLRAATNLAEAVGSLDVLDSAYDALSDEEKNALGDLLAEDFGVLG